MSVHDPPAGLSLHDPPLGIVHLPDRLRVIGQGFFDILKVPVMGFFSFLKILSVRFQLCQSLFVFLRSFLYARKGFFPLLQGLFLFSEKDSLFLQFGLPLFLFRPVFFDIPTGIGQRLQGLLPDEIVPDPDPFGGDLLQRVHDLLHGFFILRAESVHSFRLFDHDLRPDKAVLKIEALILIVDAFGRNQQIGHLSRVGVGMVRVAYDACNDKGGLFVETDRKEVIGILQSYRIIIGIAHRQPHLIGQTLFHGGFPVFFGQPAFQGFGPADPVRQ